MLRRHEDSAVHEWQRRRSSLAGIAFLAYLALVLDASLYPFVGWRDRGIGPFDYIATPWPRYLLEFDLVVNVIGYLPLGLLAVYALYPRLRAARAVILVVLGAALLSGCLEALQTYLPTRVASKVDLLTNTVGALFGASIAALSVRAVLDRGRLRELRLQWFERDASAGLVLVGLWFGAILYPDALALASGSLSRLIEVDIGALRDRIASWEPTPDQFELCEVVGCASFLLGSGLVFLNLLRPMAPRLWLLFLFIIASLVAKTFGTGLTYAGSGPLVWLTPGAMLGILLASITLVAATLLAPRWRTAWSVLALSIGVVLSNGVPDNPYFGAAWKDWERGKLLNFYGLALGLNLAWPYLALLYLMIRGTPGRPRPASL